MKAAITLIFDTQTETLVTLRYPRQAKPLIDLVQTRTVGGFNAVFVPLGLVDCDVTLIESGQRLRLVYPLAQFASPHNLIRLLREGVNHA